MTPERRQEIRQLAETCRRLSETQRNLPVPLTEQEHTDLRTAGYALRDLLQHIETLEKSAREVAELNQPNLLQIMKQAIQIQDLRRQVETLERERDELKAAAKQAMERFLNEQECRVANQDAVRRAEALVWQAFEEGWNYGYRTPCVIPKETQRATTRDQAWAESVSKRTLEDGR